MGSKVIKRARTRRKQDMPKKMPPKTKEFGGKRYQRWGGRSSKAIAERDAARERKHGTKVRVHPVELESGKKAYWLYYRDKSRR